MKFSVIYTHHKTQKRKIWKDGYLKVDTNFKKATLHEEGGNQLDLKWLSGVKISAGDELDLPRYLVQVEHPDLGGDTGVVKATVAKADNSTSNIENVLVGDQQEHLRQTYGDKNEDSRLPKFELKPFIRHKVPNGSTSLNDQPQPIPEISSATSRPSGRIKTSPKSDDPSAHRLDLSVVAHRHDRNLGLSRIAKPTIDFLCFSPEAVYRTSQEVGEPPVHFDSFEAYQTYHINLLEEYIQSILEELYQKLKLKLGEFGEQASKSMGSKATEFRLFSNGEVRVFASGSFPTEPPKSKVDVGFDGSRVPPRCESVQIALQGSYNNSEFSKDDLWILSTKLSFPLEETVVLRSLYHGVSGGKIHGHALTSRDSCTLPSLLRRFNKVEPVALRGSNVGAELLMLDNLRHVYTPTPLLDHLMDPTKSTADLPSSYAPEVWGDLFGRIRSLSAEGLEAFKSHVQRLLLRLKLEHALNSDQERSLADFAAQLFSPTKPTLLIHGVFGSGKSHLIAVMILFMGQVASYFGEEVPPPKVLVASMTNTAVDNILQLLLIKGFDRFVRVGSLKRIQRSILPYSVQSKTRVEDDIRELRSMYEDSDVSDSDIQLIDSTIKRFQSNDPHYSTSAILNRTHVVGATCLASSFPCLDGIAFSVVILDEVSQLTEPMSMLPILKFHARTVVLVGDPLQLPPTIPSADHRPILQRRLRFTLFDRLLKAGVVPVMLKAQYRCHPQLSKISNNLFYHSKLSDGITSSDRPPCLEGLPTLCFVDVSGGKEQRQFGKRSLHNEDEIRVISDLIQGLFQSNVPLSDIGVIAMYKLQVEMLQHELGLRALASPKVRHGVRISTVDAFQGAEMEIMIVSCVRSSHSTSPFLNNPHRINVALTRGRRHLFLVGNAKLLRKHSIWRDIIENHCKRAPGGFMPDDEFLSLLNVCPSAPKPPEPVRRKLASKPRLTGLSAPFRPPTKMKPKSPKDLQPKSHNADVPLAAEAPTFPFLPEPGWPQSPPPSAAMEVSPKRSASTPNATLEKFLVTQDSSGHKFQNVSGLNELYDEDLEGGSSTQPLYDQPYDMDALEFSSQADPDYSVIFKRLLDE